MLRRFTGLLLTVPLALLSLGGAPPRCTSHDVMPGSMPMSHAGMAADGDMGSAMTPFGDCMPAPQNQPPCDQHDVGACATMTSCLTMTAEVASPSLSTNAMAIGVIFRVVGAHGSGARTPEPPPPRA